MHILSLASNAPTPDAHYSELWIIELSECRCLPTLFHLSMYVKLYFKTLKMGSKRHLQRCLN